MKNLFRGYYAPTDEELNGIWDNGLIVLDTNALLNLFRYTERTRDEFFLVLNRVAEQLWIPHQIGLEFQRRRLDVIEDQAKAYDELEKAVAAGENIVIQALQSFRLHPLLSRSAITELLGEGMRPVSDAVNQSRADYNARVVAGGENERVSDIISDLYTSRVGQPFDKATLDVLYAEGAARYEAKVPPGFKDNDKREPDRYGDLVLWKQLLAHASEVKRPALFITDDGKEDWWRRVKGKTHGPRVELIDEYFEDTGQRIHFYPPERFLDFAKKKLGISVSDDSLSEVEEVSREQPLLDTNPLFHERAKLQALRNEAQKALYFDISSPQVLETQLAQVESERERLKSSADVLRSQIRVMQGIIEGLGDSYPSPDVREYVENMERELKNVEHESEREHERFERLSRKYRAYGNEQSRVAHFEAQLSSADARIREIDDLIDGKR